MLDHCVCVPSMSYMWDLYVCVPSMSYMWDLCVCMPSMSYMWDLYVGPICFNKNPRKKGVLVS